MSTDTASHDDAAAVDDDELSRPPSTGASSLLDRHRRGALVCSALSQLPGEIREVVVLVYFGGHSPTEVAAKMRLPLPTVNRNLYRGLRQIGTLLDESPLSNGMVSAS